jgi:CRP/FNR family transcriptional regulator
MKHFKRGLQIGLENNATKNVYFLKKGTIKIVSLCSNGEELIRDIIKKGDIFGILGLLQGESEDDYAVAMEDTVVCIIDAATLQKMMSENQNLNNYIFKLAGIRIKKLERRLESLIYKDAKTRVQEFVFDYLNEFGIESGEFVVADFLLNNKDIGRLTSTSRQTVNKTLNHLRTKGIIDFDNNALKIRKSSSYFKKPN